MGIYNMSILVEYYYLIDDGFTNGGGFLSPYSGQRYHLNEWKDGRQPITHMEFF